MYLSVRITGQNDYLPLKIPLLPCIITHVHDLMDSSLSIIVDKDFVQKNKD